MNSIDGVYMVCRWCIDSVYLIVSKNSVKFFLCLTEIIRNKIEKLLPEIRSAE